MQLIPYLSFNGQAARRSISTARRSAARSPQMTYGDIADGRGDAAGVARPHDAFARW